MKDIARPDIKPAFAERNVSVVFSTDENYLPYVSVALNSAIANSDGCNLDVIVMYSDIRDEAVQAFIARYIGSVNVSVRFVEISNGLSGTLLADFEQVDRLPLAACYRLLLPYILTAYDKVVYLDVDVAVCRSLAELYSVDLDDCYFAAVKDIVYSTKTEYVQWAASWDFTEWEGYVNTGVLVMNLARFRHSSVLNRLLKIAVEASRWLCDQDALNFVCKGEIASLDPRWNMQLGDYCLKKQIALIGDDAWIMHFTGSQKPWKYPVRRYSHRWWLHADKDDVSRLWRQVLGDTSVSMFAETSKISIIIPVYNAAKYLSEALASVLFQKEMPEIEVICVDDGSTDDSAAILEFWKGLDPRIQVIRQTNQGAGVARNVGLDVANGEYIYFLDADDRISSGAAFLQAYEQVKADNLDLLLADSSIMSEDGGMEKANGCLKRNLIPSERVFAPDALGENLFLITPMWPSGKLFKRKFIDENELRFPLLKRSEDFPMIQLALSLAYRIGVMDRPLFDRRIGVTTSLESTKDETPLIFADAERIFRDSLLEPGLQDRFKRAADASFIVNLAYNLCKVNRFSSFRVIARLCAEKLPELTGEEYQLGGGEFAFSLKRVMEAAAAVDNVDVLADVFANILDDKNRQHYGNLWRQKTAAEKAKAELWREKQELGKAKTGLWVRLQESEKRKAELWREKQELEKAKADLWVRLQKKEVELRRLAELVQRLAKTVE